MKRTNALMVVFFVIAVLLIAVVAFAIYQSDVSNHRAASEYTCSLAYPPRSSQWQDCVDKPH